MNLILCTSSFVLSFIKIFHSVSDFLSGQDSIVKFQKGHNSIKHVDGIIVLAFCKSSYV